MADFITYKGFKIEKHPAGYSAWGKSLFYPIDSMYYYSKSLAKVKRCINDWLKAVKVKKWRTVYEDCICKDGIVWPR
jgi:hypothetical protein